MKLLFVASSRIPSERAMGTAIMKQCEAFRKAGVVVDLVVPRRHNTQNENPFTYHQVEASFSIHYLWSLDFTFLGDAKIRFVIQRITFLISVYIYLLRQNVDAVYSREPELVTVLPTKAARFVELHHLYGLGLFGKRTLSSCSRIFTITHALRADVSNTFHIPLTKIEVAPSGVDLNAFTVRVPKEEVRGVLGVMTPFPVAMYIGALEEWKGYRTFLEAAKLLEGRVHCVVIGGKQAVIHELEKEFPEVQFLGELPQRDLAFNQQAADVLVVPNSAKEPISARHTSPLKMFAHMASGIPIVATKVTSIMEVLHEGNAYLVAPDSPESLAQGIDAVFSGGAHSSELSERAREDVVQYAWSVRTEKILGYMRMIVQSKNTNGSQKSSHRRQILTFIVVGIFVALFNIISFAFFEQILKLQYLVASTITFVLTVLVSFLLQKNVTFNNRGHVARAAKQQLVLYGVNAIFCLFLNWGIMLIGVEYMGASAYVAQVVSMILLAMYNFSVYRWILT